MDAKIENKAEKPASPAEEIRVRPGTVADIPAVQDLDAEVTGLAKPEYWRELFDADGAIRESRRCFLVAETTGNTGGEKTGEGGRVIGFIVGEARAWEFGSPPCGWVFALSVNPAERLSGVGSRLMEAISDHFRKAGVKKMRTMLSRDNHLIMSFFRSHGMMAGPYIQLEKELD